MNHKPRDYCIENYQMFLNGGVKINLWCGRSVRLIQAPLAKCEQREQFTDKRSPLTERQNLLSVSTH
jgi:hypothetical protein